MKQVYEFFAKRSGIAPMRLLWAASIGGFMSSAVLYILNTGASNAARDGSLTSFLVSFVAAELIFIFCQRYLLLTTLRETEQVLDGYRQLQLERARHCDLDTFERIGPARFFAAVTQQTKILSSSVSMIVMASQFVIVVFFAIMYLAWLSIPAVLLTLLVLSLGGTVYHSRMMAAHANFVQTAAEENTFFETIDNLVKGFKEIRLNAARSAEFAEFASSISRRIVGLKESIDVKLTELFLLFHMVFFGLAAGIVFVLPAAGIVESEHLLKIITVVLFMIGPIVNIIGSATAVANANAACAQMVELEQLLEASSASHGVPDQLRGFDRIRLRGAVYRHAGGENDDSFEVGPIDLELCRGEALFISGGNGSGKSTLLKLLTALYLPHQGGVFLDGALVGSDNRAKYQSLFSTVFSDFHLFERTFGLQGIDEAVATGWLRKMGLADKTALRNGVFDTIRLSTGQRKRLALVVALLEDRPIYILDEFAADQDPEFRRKFYEEILPEMRERGKTVVVVTHDERYFGGASRRVVMEEGRLIDQGVRA